MIIKSKFFLTGPLQNLRSFLRYVSKIEAPQKNIYIEKFTFFHNRAFVIITDEYIRISPIGINETLRKDIPKYNICSSLPFVKEIITKELK